MILVVGASGTLGAVLVERLAAAGHDVRAAGRDPAALVLPGGVERIRADVRDRASLRAAMAGADTVIAAFHGVAPPTRANHPGIVDGVGAKAVIDEAVAAGIGRFVLVSVRGAAADAPARFLRLKHEAEEHLRSTDLRWTIVRPAAFMEVHALQLLGAPLLAGRTVRFVGAGSTPIAWVSVSDVADTITATLDDDSPDRKVIELASRPLRSRIGALGVLEDATGRNGRRSHLPRGVAAVLQRVGGVLHPGLGYLLEAALAEEAEPGHPTPSDDVVEAPTTLERVAAAWAAASR